MIMRRTSWLGCALAAMLVMAGCGGKEAAELASAPSPTAESPSATTPAQELAESPEPAKVEPSPEDAGNTSSPVEREADDRAGTPTTAEEPSGYLEAVIADAARRAGVARSEVQVVRNQTVQWSDGSLGCPEPGMAYIQVIVDGYWVELRAGGKLYDYRLDRQGNFRLCEQAFRKPPYQDR